MTGEGLELTPEEKRTARGKAIKRYNEETPSWKQNDGGRFDVILDCTIEAQLVKVEPLIRKNEKERILDKMEKGYLPSESPAFRGSAIRMLMEEDWQTERGGK